MNTKEERSDRDNFIVDKAKDFSVQEIQLLLKKQGYAPVSRARIYQVLERAGVKPK